VAGRPPVMGLLPDASQLGATLAEIGLRPKTHVVAYDEEGGGKAARLLWTLDVIGHRRYSLLDGGIHAWVADQGLVSQEIAAPFTGNNPVSYTNQGIADLEYVRARLGDPDVVLLDCRTPGEFSGEVKRAERAGHIKGAVNYDWINATDRDRKFRLRPSEVLLRVLTAVGGSPDKEVIVYCQTHHRSAHT
jgi:thiosulfate/3-mercaptopyruvate sulfurtransferase